MDYFTFFTDPENAVAVVHEFFDGKYTPEEVQHKLFHLVDEKLHIRQGVKELAVEWEAESRTTGTSIDSFYKTTDNYIFDLLPWNACGMFKQKVDPILELIEQSNYNSIVDFGGGIGFFCLVAATRFPDKQFYYTDFLESKHAQFAQFLCKKYNITNVTFVDIETEFGDAVTSCDLVVALDVFEHVADLSGTIEKLTAITYNIYHDSTFQTTETSPQHINTPKPIDFINMCAVYNMLPRNGNFNHLSRIYLEFDDTGKLLIKNATK